MQPAKEPEFERPPISVSDVVLWCRDGRDDEARSPALVMRLGTRTVQLKVFSSASPNAVVKESVHHKDDPLRKKGNRGDDGCWEYGPTHKMFHAIIGDMESSLGRHQRLDTKVNRLAKEIVAIRRALKTGKDVEPVEEELPADEPASQPV